METNKVVVTTIEHCIQCPYHLIVPDPDDVIISPSTTL